MNNWQTEFTRKLDTVRAVASQHFEQVAEQTLTPTYEEFRRFATQEGLRSTAPLSKKGVRTFNFTFSENAYVLLTFHLDGLQHCKFLGEFCVPNLGKLPEVTERLAFGDIDTTQVSRVFEHALDRFLDALVESLKGKREGHDNPTDSERKSNRKRANSELEESSLRR